jgi:hypothetical protein
MKKGIEFFTDEIKAKTEKYKSDVRNFYNGIPFIRKLNNEYIELVYKIADRKKPVIIYADDPNQYRAFFELMQQAENMKIIKEIYKLKNSKDKDIKPPKGFKDNIDNYSDSIELQKRNRELLKDLYDEFEIANKTI